MVWNTTCGQLDIMDIQSSGDDSSIFRHGFLSVSLAIYRFTEVVCGSDCLFIDYAQYGSIMGTSAGYDQ